MKKLRSRNFLITINNPNDAEIETIEKLESAYKIYSFEKAPKTGTRHIHVYISFKNARRLSAIKKLFPRANIQICKGTPTQNINYVKKHGNFEESGTPPKQGKRSDLANIGNEMLQGANIRDIANKYPGMFIKYAKGMEKLQCLQYTARKSFPKVYWLYGTTGTGKTRTAVQHSETGSFYIKDLTKWWDGYAQQEVIIIDDYDGNWPFRNFLRLLDRYPYQGQYKGGYIHINSPIIYITSEFGPEFWYKGTQLEQIKRRIKESGGYIKRMIKLAKVDSQPPLKKRKDPVPKTAIFSSKNISNADDTPKIPVLRRSTAYSRLPIAQFMKDFNKSKDNDSTITLSSDSESEEDNINFVDLTKK